MPAYNEELLVDDAPTMIPTYSARVYAVNECPVYRLQENIRNDPAHDNAIIPVKMIQGKEITRYKRVLQAMKMRWEDGRGAEFNRAMDHSGIDIS
ncbi:hypothetical protein [Methanosphaerula subterraneus]|uniref:hypothetical protein n=1 Tax=Methanosphaerula subterraneus TaxID=3350244 RepID=UPI003F854C09